TAMSPFCKSGRLGSALPRNRTPQPLYRKLDGLKPSSYRRHIKAVAVGNDADRLEDVFRIPWEPSLTRHLHKLVCVQKCRSTTLQKTLVLLKLDGLKPSSLRMRFV